jgi:hypothetical protein
MPIEEVRGLLGSPLKEFVQDGHMALGSEKTDRLWTWYDRTNGVRLQMEFGDGQLRKVDSWIRTILRDFFDNETRPILFTLSEDGTAREGSDFTRIYCP